ncbi:Protein CBG26712 [Caenorhabditis briggsae]|uniref:Protein CBG26712 n=1 Tax=Caenorhabditis briggsae TaxID=6238 RepID=H8WHC2_CAEBR|nr:Protein CBG26712 [Caenorhabditis briggsae]CCG58624.1 Protein CBG26712 [Caenorhabditis briggsae]
MVRHCLIIIVQTIHVGYCTKTVVRIKPESAGNIG